MEYFLQVMGYSGGPQEAEKVVLCGRIDLLCAISTALLYGSEALPSMFEFSNGMGYKVSSPHYCDNKVLPGRQVL